MPNIAALLKQEIARVARKELRAETEGLRKALSAQRTQLVELKRELKGVQAQLRQLARAQPLAAKAARSATASTAAPSARSTRLAGTSGTADASAAGVSGTRLRFTAKGLATNRQRLGLSAEEFGQLIGVTGQSVYAWEAGRSQPRQRQLAAIAALRGVGKREVRARLAQR